MTLKDLLPYMDYHNEGQSGLDTATTLDIEKLKCAMVNVKVLCKGSKYYSKKSDKDIAMIERLVKKEIEWFDCYEDYTISNVLLLAICKQAKELGWLSVTI